MPTGKEAQREWRAKNPGYCAAYMRGFRKRHPGYDTKAPERKKIGEADRRRYKHQPEPTRARPDACECCARVTVKLLHLDHDHTTNAFRGWLCSQCNLGLGLFGDSTVKLQNAIAYLQKFGNKP
jgi:hypothetical protein